MAHLRWHHRDAHQLDLGLRVEQLGYTEQTHRRIAAAEVPAPRVTELPAESSRYSGYVGDEHLEADEVVGLAAGGPQRGDQVVGASSNCCASVAPGADLTGEVDRVAGPDGVREAARLAQLRALTISFNVPLHSGLRPSLQAL